MNLGNNIKTLRKQVGLTQTELAEKLGVSEQTVSKWENDKCYPDVSLLPLLANIFNLYYTYLNDFILIGEN